MNPANRPSASELLKHPFLKIGRDQERQIIRRKSISLDDDSDTQRRIDDVIDNLYEYHSALGDVPEFLESHLIHD